MSEFTIYNMDVLDGLKQLSDNSVDVVVTSPPYYCLRSYGVDGQIGLEKSPQEYIDKIVGVMDEVKRVLKPSGSLWLNLGDTYFKSGGAGGDYNSGGLRDGQPKYRQNCSEKSNWLRPKQRLLIPHRIAIAMQERGWLLRNEVVWEKCLAHNTSVICKVDGKLWQGDLRELFELKNMEKEKIIMIPSNIKGKLVWLKILNVFKSGQKRGVEIELTNGKKIVCSEDHLIPVKTNCCGKRKKYIKITLKRGKDVKKGDGLFLNKTPLLKEKKDKKKYLEGMYVGFFLAEGNFIKRKRYNKGTIYSRGALKRWAKNMEIEEYLRTRKTEVGVELSCGTQDLPVLKKLDALFKLKIYRYKNTIAGRCYDRNLIFFLKKYVTGETSHNKHLTKIAFQEGFSFLKGVCDGFLLGDGCLYKNEKHPRWVVGITANMKLAKDLESISQIIGYTFRWRKETVRRTTKKGTKWYKCIGFQIQKNRFKKGSYKDLQFQLVRNAKFVDKIEMFDVVVEPFFGTLRGKGKKQGETIDPRLVNWNHLFFTGNGILTHNCNSMPSSVKSRLTNHFEYIFFFVKDDKYFFDLDNVRVPHLTEHKEIEEIKINSPFVENSKPKGYQTLSMRDAPNPNEPHAFHPLGKNPGDVFSDELQTAFFGNPPTNIQKSGGAGRHPLGKNPGDILRLTNEPFSEAHFATFPSELPRFVLKAACPKQVCPKCGKPRERIVEITGYRTPEEEAELQRLVKETGVPRQTMGIKVPSHTTRKELGWTDCGCGSGFKAGVVLDPFVGSGTTLKVAQELGFNGIGIELNKAYIPLIVKRLNGDSTQTSLNPDKIKVVEGRNGL